MEQLTQDQLDCFQELFDVVNKDGDGSITSKELEVMLRALGGTPRESEVQDMINEADSDGNGTLEIDEFVEALLRKMTVSASIEELREAFFIFDKDKNGFISSAELRTLYISLGMQMCDEDIDEMIREADLDMDGVVTLDEFIYMMTTPSYK
ncbi:calmodulin-beta [Drosophila innubila]|uniref:calmodulin-beta n=1 Tax=Drosophila innubila TaxID=198719 RepID=UPI00148BFD77|nr:calmodulin-beta [Drosophila innubila]